MKKNEQKEARLLRQKGYAMGEIAKKIGVSKASVSLWVRDIELSSQQLQSLNIRGFSVEAIEKRRMSRIANTNARHREIIEKAKMEIDQLSTRDLLLIGAALYWGEGGKSNKGMARVANSDPGIIRMMMRFFREVCDVPKEKFRGHVHTFSHLNARAAEEYWSDVSGIPLSQFFKTYAKPSIASSGKKDSLPYGTFQIYVCDTPIFLRVKGLIEKFSELAIPN